MAGRRIPLGLLAPVSLVVLVVALGALQYRWVGQVSEADRTQLRQSLDRRAREFADDFDREIGRAYQVFRPVHPSSPDVPDRFAQKFDEWQATAPYAGMVKATYLVMPRGADYVLHRYAPATRAFETADWTDALQPVRQRLLALNRSSSSVTGVGGSTNVITLTALPAMSEVPAIVIPESQPLVSVPAAAGAKGTVAAGPAGPPGKLDAIRAPGATFDLTVSRRPASGVHAIVLFDREFMTATMLPALAARHFPDDGADRFRMKVLDAGSRTLLARGLPDGESIDLLHADAAALFFGVRIEAVRSMASGSLPPTSPGGPSSVMSWSTHVTDVPGVPTAGRGERRGTSALVVARPAEVADRVSMVIEQHSATMAGAAGAVGVKMPTGWTVLLQHAAGSLDAAVERARRRNLLLSFGILSVLAASAGLVMINARRSEKLAAQQMDFVATVSHELRTPLAVIRSAAQNLAAGVIHEPGQAKRYGELIEDEGRRLTDMVEQVLEYAGLSGNRRPPESRLVDAARLARDVVSASRSLPEAAAITFDVRVDDHLPQVMADEDAIRRALINLISNALKYGGDGRWVGVAAIRGTGRDEGQVLISVADRGRGIPPDELAHIFEPFYRGRFAQDRQIHGNGLGLSLVKRIVDAHGGRVSVKSAPEQGSTFTLHLPVAAGAVAAHSATDASVTPDAGLDAPGSTGRQPA